MYTCGMILLVGHLCTAVDGLPSRGENHDDDQNRSAWVKCLDVLRVYQEFSRTARKCLKLLELSETRFWPSPIQHEYQQPLPAGYQSTPSAVLNDVSLMTTQGFNPAFAHHQQYQQNSLQHSVPPNPMMMTDNIDFQNLQGQNQNHHQFWTDEPIDVAWLNALPFEISLEDTIHGMF